MDFFVRLTPELTQVKSRSHAPGLIVVANFQGLMSLPGTRESILVSAATNTIRTLGNANHRGRTYSTSAEVLVLVVESEPYKYTLRLCLGSGSSFG